jgi:tRNA pseudouridine13 synthase
MTSSAYHPRVLPYLTSDVPGTGGVLRARVEDFEVDELPAYVPTGRGDHVMVRVEKRGLTTPDAAERLARACGVDPSGVGWAGMKDRHAVTRQWMTLPPPTTPEAVLAASVEGVTVLEAVRHPHKMKTGHARGNVFAITVRDVAAGALETARAVLERLAAHPGSPNWFGEQRFGALGDNAARGRALLAGEKVHAPPKIRRLLISSVQSELFNAWLAARLADGLYAEVIDGDVLIRRGEGSVVTGPMFGPRMRAPAPGSAAAAREDAVLAAAGLTVDAFAAAGKLAEGTRRPVGVEVRDVAVEPVGETAITVRFSLPAGAYATAVLPEVMK